MNSNQSPYHGGVDLYVLGALSGEERREIEAALARGEISPDEFEAALRSMLILYEEVAESMPSPRRALKESIMAAIVAEEQYPKSEPSKIIVRAVEGRWRESGLPGIRIKLLFLDRNRDRKTYLARIDPGSTYPDHRHGGVEECLLLEGDLHIDDQVLGPGDFFLALPETIHRNAYTEAGCMIYVSSSLHDELFV
jgi:anti-sigma factor ChrR (cupin superfamily)